MCTFRLQRSQKSVVKICAAYSIIERPNPNFQPHSEIPYE